MPTDARQVGVLEPLADRGLPAQRLEGARLAIAARLPRRRRDDLQHHPGVRIASGLTPPVQCTEQPAGGPAGKTLVEHEAILENVAGRRACNGAERAAGTTSKVRVRCSAEDVVRSPSRDLLPGALPGTMGPRAGRSRTQRRGTVATVCWRGTSRRHVSGRRAARGPGVNCARFAARSIRLIEHNAGRSRPGDDGMNSELVNGLFRGAHVGNGGPRCVHGGQAARLR